MSSACASTSTYGEIADSVIAKLDTLQPKTTHKATIVWLHGLGDNSSSWIDSLRIMECAGVKWICPSAPLSPVKLLGDSPSTAWYNITNLSEDAPVEELDKIAEYVASILVGEPSDIKLGIGGFSMGASVALYSAICYARGRFGNGKDYPVKLSAIVGYSGWLPCSKLLEGIEKAAGPARSLPIFLSHCKDDGLVPDRYTKEAAQKLKEFGFQDLTVKLYSELYHHSGHSPYVGEQQARNIRKWIIDKMEIGSIWAIQNLEETSDDVTYVEEDFVP